MSSNQPPPPPAYGQQPYPQGQQPPPQGSYQQAPPPKKSHTLRNVFLGIIFAFILILGACSVLLGGVANEIDKSISEEEANDKPVEVKEGAAFTHDDYKAQSGWKVVKDMGSASIEGLKVTNNADDARTALLTFAFYKGNENLGEVECSSNGVQPGEVSSLDCISFDSKFPDGYESIKVADAF
jgi:hypothetical protein